MQIQLKCNAINVKMAFFIECNSRLCLYVTYTHAFCFREKKKKTNEKSPKLASSKKTDKLQKICIQFCKYFENKRKKQTLNFTSNEY